MKNIIFLILSFSFIFISCEEENQDNDVTEGSYLEEFIYLESDLDTIHFLDTTRIVANAKGRDLKYSWSTNSNAPILPIEDIDSAVYFYADPCVSTGIKQIFCWVEGENKKEMKVDTVVIIN